MRTRYRILFILFLLIMFNSLQASETKKVRVVQFLGTAIGEDRMIDDGEGGVMAATCFEIDMRNLKTGKKIGKGVDCLSNVTAVGGGLSVLATSYFMFKKGTVVSRGLTSVQPKTTGSPGFTHITGAIPAVDDKTIVASLGTGKFAGRSGQARLSGAVAMKTLADGRLEIKFNCIFVLSVDRN